MNEDEKIRVEYKYVYPSTDKYRMNIVEWKGWKKNRRKDEYRSDKI
jgi:hypothetical protein